MSSSNTSAALSAPHRNISTADDRERFTLELFDALWRTYRERVSYVRDYEAVVARCGATFVNDHIAFRTIACQRPATGISSLSRIFEALGYRAAGSYVFPDKHLGSLHFQHANASFPKLFISELKLWEFPREVREIVLRTLSTHREVPSDETLASLWRIQELSDEQWQTRLDDLVRFIHNVPWAPPEKQDVQSVNKASQFAAWVLVHGCNVNHFTCLVNSHGVADLGDIETTIARLKQAGVPMKDEIEGQRGSKLRQTATEAVMIDVPVAENGRRTTMPWTYAYFEIAERGEIADPETGRPGRFEGFLGPQATQLFEMTQVKS